MNKDKALYYAIRIFLFPVRFLPFKAIHFLGRYLGRLLYNFHHKFRKRALSNLSLAKDLRLNYDEIIEIAKQSFENLTITCLEYAKFATISSTKDIIVCKNPQLAQSYIDKGQGIIFFCGHQANWEVLFLDGIQRMPGIAIGRAIKNPFLYQWIIGIREKFGGKIISPQNALKEGLRGLRQGKFLGIVGDQGMPESGYFHNFLGQKAWTSPAPALLAYKTKSPIMVATTKREKGRYFITYSDPIWPDTSKPLEEEMPRMMDEASKIFEKSVLETPGQWLWQHNRFKQEMPRIVYYRYRYDCILIILPKEKEKFKAFLPSVNLFREIYPKAFLTFFVFEDYASELPKNIDTIFYKDKKDLFLKDLKYKFVINFSGVKALKKHYLKQSAISVVDFNDIKKDAETHMEKEKHYTLLETITRAMCRPGTLWEQDGAKSLLH